MGYVYFAVFAPLSAIRVVDVVQTWFLFHNALSEGVVVDDILKQARQSQDVVVERPERGDRAAPTPGRAPAAGARRAARGPRRRVGLLPGRGVAAAAAGSDSDSAVGGGRRPSAPASLSPPADAAAFSFSSPAEMPPRDAMSDPAPASTRRSHATY